MQIMKITYFLSYVSHYHKQPSTWLLVLLSLWLVYFNNKNSERIFIHCAIKNLHKVSLDQNILPLKYVRQHTLYLFALCQMSWIIPICCHMCMEACSIL